MDEGYYSDDIKMDTEEMSNETEDALDEENEE